MDPSVDRCWWCGTDPLYVAYHDDEWGRPITDERALFENLCLDGAQAGLAWITILRKRDGYRDAFEGFDPQRVAAYGEHDLARLLDDARIVRNRAKVNSVIRNAQALLAMHDEGESLSALAWSFRPERHVRPKGPEDVPAVTPEAEALSKELKRRGFSFVGPTIVYAFMQACGIVDDHLVTCFRARSS